MLSGHKKSFLNLNIQKIIWLTALFLLSGFIVTKVIYSSIITSVPPNPIVIGYSNSPSWWPWAIVESKGLIKKNEINVEFRWYDNYSDSVRDLDSGFIDGNSQLTADTISTSPKAIRGKVGVLLNSYSKGADKIIVSQEIHTIEDLKGKQIIAEVAGDENQLLSLALASDDSRLSINDIHLRDFETGLGSAAFAVNEEVDGVVSFPPYSKLALTREGSHELITSKAFPQEISRMLVLSEKITDKQPKIVEEIIDAWFEALDFINQFPNEASQIVSERFGIEPEDFRQFQQEISLVSRNINSQSLVETIAKYK